MSITVSLEKIKSCLKTEKVEDAESDCFKVLSNAKANPLLAEAISLQENIVNSVFQEFEKAKKESKELSNKIKIKQDEFTNIQNKVTNDGVILQQRSNEVSNKQTQLTNIQNQVATKSTTLQQRNNEVQNKQTDYNTANNEVNRLLAELRQKNSSISSVESDLKSTKNSLVSADRDNCWRSSPELDHACVNNKNNLRSKIKNYEQKLDQEKHDLTNIRDNLNNWAVHRNKAEDELQNAKNLQTDTQNQLDHIVQSANPIENQLNNYQNQKNQAQNTLRQSKELKTQIGNDLNKLKGELEGNKVSTYEKNHDEKTQELSSLRAMFIKLPKFIEEYLDMIDTNDEEEGDIVNLDNDVHDSNKLLNGDIDNPVDEYEYAL